MTDKIDTSNEAVGRLVFASVTASPTHLSAMSDTLCALAVERDRLRGVACEAMSQLRWLNEKEQRGSTNTVLARLEHALRQDEGGE